MRLLKNLNPDSDIVLVVYREDTYYTQPPMPTQDSPELRNGPVSVNTNANNSVQFQTPSSALPVMMQDEELKKDPSIFPIEVS